VKLHLGCGKRDFGPEWIHIDGGDFPHLYSHDVSKLPFGDNSVDIIYASHVLEYFDRDEVIEILKEWRRTLKINGTLRLAVPDFRKMMFLYLRKDYPIENFLGPIYGKMKMIRNTIYHKTAYDYESLFFLLKNNGFKDMRFWNWEKVEHGKFDDFSQSYLPHMDKENGTLISLNIECNKI